MLHDDVARPSRSGVAMPPLRRLVTVVAAALLLPFLALTPPVGAVPTEPFFSEYVEGTSNNKALEVANPTAIPIDLGADGYAVRMYFNGSATVGLTITLTGTIAPGDVFVLAQSSANPTILAQADQTNGAGWFNGDDAVVLVRGSTVLDSVGQVVFDPGTEWGTGLTSTADNTLRRKAGAGPDTATGDPFDPAGEWDGFPTDTFDGLGHPGAGTGTPPPPPPPTVLPIGTVQGQTTDAEDGATDASPYAGQTVVVRGVVHSLTLTGGGQRGFFLQNTAATADGDVLTSDGIFVFMSRFTSLIGGYVPQVADEVVISGRVSEFFNFTQLSSAGLVERLRTGVDLDVEVPAFEMAPPDDLDAAERYWERREGMRARLPAGSLAVSGRDVFGSSGDAEVWAIRGDHPVARRADPYARRVFRDPHPLDNRPELFDDANGYRIVLGSLGLKGITDDPSAILAPARTFDTVTNAPTGGVYFSFGKYQVQVTEQLVLAPGADPAANAPPQAPTRELEWSASTFNVENLYDFRDDPTDGCDFAGNAGCPGVSPPFDYVPSSDADYRAHLGGLAAQVVGDLHAPDLLLVQEAEDQDICSVAGAVLACGATGDGDGKPDTLQELALAIAAAAGPAYDAVLDRDGADDRGIVSGFLYRSDRVELLPATAADPVLGTDPGLDYRGAPLDFNTDVSNPKALNAVLPADVDRSTGTDGSNVFTRAPQVGRFRIWRGPLGTSTFIDVWAVSNHFSSGPDRRVGQRREQAAYNAAIARTLEAAGEQRALVGGDLNVFPRPDDPFRPGDTRFPSDQLAPLYDAGLFNLYDLLVAEVPSSAYSYVFEGQAQTLDHLFVSEVLRAEVGDMRAAHVNADWPADHDADGARGVSDHDPQVATFSLGAARPICGGQAATIVGTEGVDKLFGTVGPDVIVGLGGNDSLYGLGGNDVICGGAGDDVIDGGAGNDMLEGGTGRDRVIGGLGDDDVRGDDDADSLFGGNGNDVFDGGTAGDTCNGGTGTNAFVACEVFPAGTG